jgi:hypothetical protein
MSKVRGIMSALLVNDIDAGLGRFEVRAVVFSQQSDWFDFDRVR